MCYFFVVFSYARYHPTKGHYWEFPTDMQSGMYIQAVHTHMVCSAQLHFLHSRLLFSCSHTCTRTHTHTHAHTCTHTGASKLTATQSLVQEPSDSQCKRVEKLFLKLVEKYPYKALASKVGGVPNMVLGYYLHSVWLLFLGIG